MAERGRRERLARAGVDADLYPFESHWLELEGGVRMHYLDEGPRDAPAVLMVHGNPTWSFYYRDLVRVLSGRLRVVVPDHVGCGLSDTPGLEDYPYRLGRRVADLEGLVASLGLRELSMVVHDWGGMIGFGWAVRHTAAVRRLVVLNTAAFPLPEGARVPWQLRLARVPGLGEGIVRGLNGFVEGALRTCVHKTLLRRDVAAGYRAPYDSWHERLAVYRFVEDIPLAPSHPSWSDVEAIAAGLAGLRDRPMLICWGERDFVFDRHYLAEWLRRFPNARVCRYPDAGHYVLEDARAEIGAEVERFLGPLAGDAGAVGAGEEGGP